MKQLPSYTISARMANEESKRYYPMESDRAGKLVKYQRCNRLNLM